MEIEQVKFLGQVSTIMRVLASTDDDLLSYFDKINDTGLNTTENKNSFNDRLIISHSVEVNRGKIRGKLHLEHIFRFCKTFKKNRENLGFQLTFRTADLQDIIFTTIAEDITVTIESFYLFVPIIIPNTETQLMYNESIKNICTITYDSWFTERKMSTDGLEL